MTGQSLVYSNARVKAMENTLLSSEKITRMCYADSLEEGIKVLYESNYGNGVILENPYFFAEILSAEQAKVTSFMREAMPENSGLDTLLFPLDYHNAKVLIKAKLTGQTDIDYMLSPKGVLDTDTIKEAINSSMIFSLPNKMAEAIVKINQLVGTDSITPRLIDIILDKAMYESIFETLKTVKTKSLIKYWQSKIDLININILLRCKSIQADKKFFEESLMPCGAINDYNLIKLFDETYETIAEKLAYTDYRKLIDIAVSEVKDGKAQVRYEAEVDNFLISIFSGDKSDIFSVAPIAGFYLAKAIEIKMVRMILICIKNKTDISERKLRLRGFYA